MIVISTSSWAQRSTLDQVREGMDYIYNLEFKKSQATIEQIESSLQNSAIPDLMKALQAFWKYYPIHLEEDKVKVYRDHLSRSYDRSLEVLESDPGNTEAIFLAMASQGLLAESYSETGHSFKAVGAAKRAYNYIKQGSKKLNEYKEFYLSTGLYNYYREYYPEAYPIYRPFMSFFMKGNKSLGIQQLEIAAEQASIAYVIAQYYLCYIYMRYEYVPSKALDQGRSIHYKYPQNDLFSAIFLESLIINKRYNEALPVASKLQLNSSPYLKIYGDLFMGVISEKYLQNFEKAERLYHEALHLNDEYDMDRDHLEAYAYLGLGRIYESKNDPKARKYFKEALDQAYTKVMKEEAKNHLN